jgi:uncharacterized protein YndB with AHSA1/START domain
MSVLPVRKEIVVEASQARAFRVFTEEHGAWWPLATHHIGEKDAETAIIEPRVGGRWFERAADGTECLWGKVLVWDPPGRIVLSWEIGANFKYDSALSLEVEVRFVVLGPASTRIELEHRNLERLGEAAETMRGAFDSEGGWGGILKSYAARAAG